MSCLAVSIVEKGKKINSFRPRKVYGGADVQLPLFLTSALGGVDWSTSCTGRLIHRGITPNSTHCSGASVGVSDEEEI
jgi:hypothetical protein